MSSTIGRSISTSSYGSSDSVSSTRAASTSNEIGYKPLLSETETQLSENINHIISEFKIVEFAKARQNIKNAAKEKTLDEFNRYKQGQIKAIERFFRTHKKYIKQHLDKLPQSKLTPLNMRLEHEKELAVANLKSIQHQSEKPWTKRVLSTLRHTFMGAPATKGSSVTRGGNKRKTFTRKKIRKV